MSKLRLRNGKKGLEIIGQNFVVEEGSPKFRELMEREGSSISFEEGLQVRKGGFPPRRNTL